MAARTVSINRAPVLTLWTAVVAARLGYSWQEALTLGRAVAGLDAQSKGRRLGIYEEREEPARKAERTKREEQRVNVLGRQVPVRQTREGLRAISGDRLLEPASVERYLRARFGDDLQAVQRALTDLAASYPPQELSRTAYRLYERFRPHIAPGARGWGQKGELDLDLIHSLRKSTRRAA